MALNIWIPEVFRKVRERLFSVQEVSTPVEKDLVQSQPRDHPAAHSLRAQHPLCALALWLGL